MDHESNIAKKCSLFHFNQKSWNHACSFLAIIFQLEKQGFLRRKWLKLGYEGSVFNLFKQT